MTGLATAVTALFVPGNRPDRFVKAARSGADLMIIDLEDAVAPESRDAALRATLDALRPGEKRALTAVVRVCDPATDSGREQVDALTALSEVNGHGLRGLMIPKAAEADVVARTAAGLARAGADIGLVALIESAAGVDGARELARVKGVARLAFGALDLGLDLGVEPDSLVVRVAQAQIVIASRAAGLPAPLDTPSIDIADRTAVAAAAAVSRSLGFGGKLCIHPAQLEPVRAAFRPTAAEIRWAEQIIAAADDDAVQVGGQMVDRPVLERARRIRARMQELTQ